MYGRYIYESGTLPGGFICRFYVMVYIRQIRIFSYFLLFLFAIVFIRPVGSGRASGPNPAAIPVLWTRGFGAAIFAETRRPSK